MWFTANTVNHMPGPYRVAHYRNTGTSVVTTKALNAAYRAAGRPAAAVAMARLMAIAARARGVAPAAAAQLRAARRHALSPGTHVQGRRRRQLRSRRFSGGVRAGPGAPALRPVAPPTEIAGFLRAPHRRGPRVLRAGHRARAV